MARRRPIKLALVLMIAFTVIVPRAAAAGTRTLLQQQQKQLPPSTAPSLAESNNTAKAAPSSVMAALPATRASAAVTMPPAAPASMRGAAAAVAPLAGRAGASAAFVAAPAPATTSPPFVPVPRVPAVPTAAGGSSASSATAAAGPQPQQPQPQPQQQQPLQKPLQEQQAQEVCYRLSWRRLARSGDRFPSGVWGALKARSGGDVLEVVPEGLPRPPRPAAAFELAPGLAPKNFSAPPGYKLTPAISSGPDFPSFHTAGNVTYMVNHFEYPQPAVWYLSELRTDARGRLRVADTRPIPAAEVGGLWHTRSGAATPWGTHLSGEASPPDCRAYDDTLRACRAGPDAARTSCGLKAAESDAASIAEFARFYGLYPGAAKWGLKGLDIFESQPALDAFVSRFRCYNYGASPEVAVLPGGQTRLVKWRTLGRVSHENAVIMADNRTVYLTDDHPNGVLLKFVADRPNDLSSGTLSAAKFSGQRLDPSGRPTWDLGWVTLGRGNQTYLDALARSPLRFTDIFDVAPPEGSPPRCPPGFLPASQPSALYKHVDARTLAAYFIECLRARPGMAAAAAFLEPRRYASMLGATAEFDRLDGLTWSRRLRQLYFTDARILYGGTDQRLFNHAGTDDIRLPANECGGLFSVSLDENYVGTRAQLVLAGSRATGGGADARGCSPNNIADPERTEYVAGNLLVQQDGAAAAGGPAAAARTAAAAAVAAATAAGPADAAAAAKAAAAQRPKMFAIGVDAGGGNGGGGSGPPTLVLLGPRGATLTGISVARVGPVGYFASAVQYAQPGAESGGHRGGIGVLGPVPARLLADGNGDNGGGATLRFEPVNERARGSVVASARVCAQPARPQAASLPPPAPAPASRAGVGGLGLGAAAVAAGPGTAGTAAAVAGHR